MNELCLICRLHQHRDWANRQLLAAVADLPETDLHRSFAIGQGSIWSSLTHLFGAEYVWLEALLGNEDPVAPGDAAGALPGNQSGKSPLKNLAELQEQWAVLTKRWTDYLADLTSESLSARVVKISSLTGRRSSTQAADVLLHVCTHTQYTAAQLVNMLRQAGSAERPDVMMISMARLEAFDGK